MQKLKKLYRATYSGESVVTALTLNKGVWNPETDFVPNSVFNVHSTRQAVAIGNGESREKFNLMHLKNHKGGLLGANRLQTYGCNALYRDFTPDFLVAVGDEIISEIARSAYVKENIVYAHADAILEYPGKFYLIPQNVYYNAGALAAYLACFDGHTRVYLVGYDSYDDIKALNNVYKNTRGYQATTNAHKQTGDYWEQSLAQVMETYADVDFVRVQPTLEWWTPGLWKTYSNFRQMTYENFIIEADLG